MDVISFIDPECTELFIYDFDLYPDGDQIDAPRNLDGWRTLGKQIGAHKKLRELGLCGRFRATAESLEALLRGISQNRSVRELCFIGCHGNWPLEILGSFYKNLHEITVYDCNLSHGAIRSLSAALRGCTDCSLKKIEWLNSPMGDETAVEFIQSLAGLSRLNFLNSVACDIGPRGWNAMAALLRNPDCTLTHVLLDDKRIGDEGLAALAAGLGDNRTVTHLILDHLCDITNEAWELFAGVLSTPTCMLEGLSLGDSTIDDDVMVAFSHALRGNSRLRCLRLGERSISSINWARVFGGEQMNRNISPHVLAWLGGYGRRTLCAKKSHCTAVYGFLRKMPSLCGNSCRVGRRSTRKRKVQC